MSIDLNTIIESQNYALEIAPTESEADANLRRKQEHFRFVASWVILVSGIALLAGWLIFYAPSPDDRKWIFGLLGAAFSFAIGNVKK